MELLALFNRLIIRFGRFILFLGSLLLGRSSKNVEEAAPTPVRRPLDGNPDWKLPESEGAKLATIGKERDAEVDTYLWFELGDVERLVEAETDAIIAEFFVSGKVSFGDIELHQSRMPGNPTVLRLRGNLRLRPALTLRGRYCPLYQIGYSTLFGSETDGTFNFYVLWDLPPKEQAA